MSELGKRIASGLVLAPLTVGAVYLGSGWLAIYLSVAAGVMAWELARIARAGGTQPIGWLLIAGAASVPMLTHLHTVDLVTVPVSLVTLGGLATLALAMVLRPAEAKPLSAAAITVFGVLYAGATVSFGYALRYYPYVQGAAAGSALVLLPVWLTWSADTGAYVAGRLIGGPKLAPSISPKKTIAGAVGGVAVAVGMAWAYVTWVLRPTAQVTMTTGGLVMFAVAVAVAAILGDLVESHLKREAGVKDASDIIPGHGGVLDRLDSIVFVLPVAYVLLPLLLRPAPVLP